MCDGRGRSSQQPGLSGERRHASLVLLTASAVLVAFAALADFAAAGVIAAPTVAAALTGQHAGKRTYQALRGGEGDTVQRCVDQVRLVLQRDRENVPGSVQRIAPAARRRSCRRATASDHNSLRSSADSRIAHESTGVPPYCAPTAACPGRTGRRATGRPGNLPTVSRVFGFRASAPRSRQARFTRDGNARDCRPLDPRAGLVPPFPPSPGVAGRVATHRDPRQRELVAGSAAVAAGFVARTTAECMPSATWWVGVMSMDVNPAASRPCRYSVNERAPAMQPT